MLKELTTQQQSLIPIIRDKWINKLNKPESFDKEKAKKAVEWLYQFSGLSKPEVLIFDSPLSVQIGLNALQSVSDSVSDSVRASVRDSVSDSVWNSVRASVWGSVETKYHTTSMYGDVSDFAWTSFYDYFHEIGVFNNENFNEWLEYCDAGIFYSVQLDEVCAICPMPKYIKRNNAQAMHCEDGYAIEWADGYGIYVLDGIRFDRAGQDELYWKIVRHELTLPEILAIEDIDQRAVALKYCNAQDIIKSLEDKGQATLIDTSVKQAEYLKNEAVSIVNGHAVVDFSQKVNKELTYSLYKVTIPDIFDEAEYFIVYPHASVDGLSYWKGVHPDDASKGSMYAIASSHNMTVDEYLQSTTQS